MVAATSPLAQVMLPGFYRFPFFPLRDSHSRYQAERQRCHRFGSEMRLDIILTIELWGQNLRVCYFGTYRANYSRNQIMIEGLRRNGVEVIECHQQLWHGIQDRVQVASGGWFKPGFVVRVIRTYWKLLQVHRQAGDYDVMVLGYPGQLDVYLARVLAWLRRKPLVLDVFMSLYLIASERGLAARYPITARLIYWLEKLASLLPDRLILDTAEYVQWFQKVYGLDPARFRLVPTGADDRIFYPVEADGQDDGLFKALYYGTFIPNHGVEHIVEAARILRDDPTIHFELVGDGPTKAKAMLLAQEYDLDNVTFVGWVDKRELLRRAARADVCLGVFGTTPQSMMTVQNKIYEGLAMGKPVVTGNAPTICAVFQHSEHLYLVERASGKALAEAIITLRDAPDLCRRMACQGQALFRAQYTPQALGEHFRRHLDELGGARLNE
jgi:glycosyltransferase involved in cell wall biosynthesis